jgi:hypothetical protein
MQENAFAWFIRSHSVLLSLHFIELHANWYAVCCVVQMLGHVHYTAAADIAADDLSAGSDGPVPMRVVNSSWVIAGSDSTPAGLLSEAMGFNRSEAQVPTGNEWGMIYPGEPSEHATQPQICRSLLFLCAAFSLC